MSDYDDLTPELRAVTDRINAKVDKLLEPLRREMVAMRWTTDMQALFWYHVATMAVKQAQQIEQSNGKG